jgi:hypothetical protein
MNNSHRAVMAFADKQQFHILFLDRRKKDNPDWGCAGATTLHLPTAQLTHFGSGADEDNSANARTAYCLS